MQGETPHPVPTSEVVTLGSSRVRISGQLQLLETTHGLRPLRLPTDAWVKFPPVAAAALEAMVSRPSGVRLGLRTAATDIRLVVHCTQFQLEDMLGQANSFVATVEDEEVATAATPINSIETVSFSGARLGEQDVASRTSAVDFTGLPAGEKTVEIWLPQMVTVDLVTIEAEAPIEPADPADRPVWIHHGSSISHCAEAAKPTSSWPVVTARRVGLDLVNLGYAGQCMLDLFVADAIARTPAAVISLKIGVNIVTAQAMTQRTFVPAVHGFLDRIRSGMHENTPVVLVSPILWPGNEDRPGPIDFEDAGDSSFRLVLAGEANEIVNGALSLEVVRRDLAQVVAVRAAQGEPTHYLDGRELYGPADVARHQLPDGLHPDAALYEEMGRRFATKVFGDSAPLPAGSLAHARAS